MTAALTVLAALGAGVVAGCKGPPPPSMSPQEAYLHVLKACDDDDAAVLFDALDTPTQWAIQTVHKAQKETRALVTRSYPAGPREAALARVPVAAEEELDRTRRYYRGLDGSASVLADLKRRIYLGKGKPKGSIRQPENLAEVWREGGSIFHFHRDETGRWGLLELRDLWEREKDKAVHELERARENAALYDRAGTGDRKQGDK